MLLNLDKQDELIDDDSSVPSYSTWDSNDEDKDEDDATEYLLTPAQLLSMAIKKRRVLFSHKERDYRRELLHTSLIQSLCKHLGESRANRRHLRKRRRGRRSRSPRQAKYAKCEYMDGESDTILVSGNSDSASGAAVPTAATATSFTDQIQLPTASPSLMELDKAAVIQGGSFEFAHDDYSHDYQKDSTAAPYSFGGLDDPDPFGLDDLFHQMLTQHQSGRKMETVRG